MIRLSFRDILASRVLLGGWWVSPNGEKFPVPYEGTGAPHARWAKEYLKNPKLTDEEAYSALFSKNWVRVRADVVDLSDEYGAWKVARNFLDTNVPESQKDGEIIMRVWPNNLDKEVTVNDVLEASSVYNLRSRKSF